MLVGFESCICYHLPCLVPDPVAFADTSIFLQTGLTVLKSRITFPHRSARRSWSVLLSSISWSPTVPPGSAAKRTSEAPYSLLCLLVDSAPVFQIYYYRFCIAARYIMSEELICYDIMECATNLVQLESCVLLSVFFLVLKMFQTK